MPPKKRARRDIQPPTVEQQPAPQTEEPAEGNPPDQDTGHRHRYITLTISDGSRIKIDGSEEQLDAAVDVIHSLSKTVDGILLTIENHQDGRKHMHGLISFNTSQRSSMVHKARHEFDKWVGGGQCNKIEFPKYGGRISKNYQFWMGYICKDYQNGSVKRDTGKFNDVWQPYADAFITHEHNPSDRTSAILALIRSGWVCARKNRAVEEIGNVERITNVYRVIQQCFTRMNWKVHRVTRDVIDINTLRILPKPVVFDELKKELDEMGVIMLLQDVSSCSLFEKAIQDFTGDAPTCELRFGWIRLLDCMYDAIEGTWHAIDLSFLPMAKVDCTYLEANEDPVDWVHHVNHLVHAEYQSEFGTAYAALYKKRIECHKPISIHGHARTGKDCIFAPFLRIYEPFIQQVSATDKFAVRAGYHGVYFKDNHLHKMIKDSNVCSIMKAIREGSCVELPVKHKSSEMGAPMHMTHTSQESYYDILGSNDPDIEAFKSRMVSIFVSVEKRLPLSGDHGVIKEKISSDREACRVMVKLTCTDNRTFDSLKCDIPDLLLSTRPELEFANKWSDVRKGTIHSLEDIFGIATAGSLMSRCMDIPCEVFDQESRCLHAPGYGDCVYC